MFFKHLAILLIGVGLQTLAVFYPKAQVPLLAGATLLLAASDLKRVLAGPQATQPTPPSVS